METQVTSTIGLFDRAVPHILEKIFFCLDYESYKKCLKVNRSWRELLASASYLKKAKDFFKEEIWNDESKLCLVAGGGDLFEVKKVLNPLMDVNCVRGWYKDTPLLKAFRTVESRDTDIYKLLLEAGANPNMRNLLLDTPLHYAARYDNKDAIKFLLKAGADPSKKDSFGYTPLHNAAEYGNKDAVKVLLEVGEDPNKTNKTGTTPLHRAAISVNKEVIKMLVDAGADPNKKDRYGDTPLHKAVQGYSGEVVKMLLDMGANPKIRNKYGKTPREMKNEYDLIDNIDTVNLLHNESRRYRKISFPNINDGVVKEGGGGPHLMKPL